MPASNVVHSGNDGVFQIGGTALQKMLSFEINEEEASSDRVDGMGDAWEDSVGIKKRWTGSFEARRLQSDAAGPVSLSVHDVITITAYPDGDTTDFTEITGSVEVTNITNAVDHETTNRMTVSFRGKGAMTKGTKAL